MNTEINTDRDFPVWTESFSKETREEQLDNDSEAWRSVTGLLLAIVIFGVCLALITVAIISR